MLHQKNEGVPRIETTETCSSSNCS